MSDRSVEELAQALYKAWCNYRIDTYNVHPPRWFALRHELKEHWLKVAEDTMGAYLAVQ